MNSGHLVSHGSFLRKSDSRYVRRWKCTGCGKSVSEATHHPCFGQKKRRVNERLRKLLVSGVSMRRSALLLGVHRVTVARKLRFLGIQARGFHARFLESLRNSPIDHVQFDDMETFEHSKMKPLSISLAVSTSRKILAVEVSQMPAKGLLAKRAVKKYGFRADHRPKALRKMFATLQPIVSPSALFESDQNPAYPLALRKAFPDAIHKTTLSRRGCVVGQGELKRGKWDPLFSLNHTAGMFRANVNRLFRRTWCTTKKPSALADHLALYVNFHNGVLT